MYQRQVMDAARAPRCSLLGLAALISLSLPLPSTGFAQDAAEVPDSTSHADTPSEEAPQEGGAWWGQGGEAEADAEASADASTQADAQPAEEATPEKERTARFDFGSYGRVNVGSDMRGSSGRDNDLVSFGPRVDEGSYAELEFRREDQIGDIESAIVATLGFAGPFFHFDAKFEEGIAIRNLYAEARHVFTEGLSVWAGSRMVRGDDIYLLDFWPLDNLNLLGGGLRYSDYDKWDLSLSMGLSRPDTPFQTQEVDVLAADGFTAEKFLLLDRPRMTVGSKLTHFPLGRGETALKGVLYGEYHQVSAGKRERPGADGIDTEILPADQGFVLGGEIGGWMVENRAFLNLFVKYGHGLGAYNPLGLPILIGRVVEADNASELIAGISGNYETGDVGVMLGGYYRRFSDVGETPLDSGLMTEGAIAVRPHYYFNDYFGVAADLSFQALERAELDEITGKVKGGKVYKAALIPFISPFGRGNYTRPHIRAIYAFTRRNNDARRLYPVEDTRSQRNVEHFLGLGVEWWFNSTSYQ